MNVREIAKLAGVSIGTVDRVLYNRGKVSLATKLRVEAIIEQYQFTPNPIARRLKRKQSYRFCALFPRRDQDAGYWEQALQGITEGAAEIVPLGVETEIVEYDRYESQSFQSAADLILKKSPDGLIFAPIMPERVKPFILQIQEAHIPYVFIDTDLPEMKPLSVIGQDPFKGGYLAGRLMHLFAGTIDRPVAILDVHGGDYHITRRRDGFLKYAQEHSFETVVQEYSDYQGTEISEEEIGFFLRAYPDLSGIFITNCMAHRVVAAAEKEKTDRRFILVGYDLIPHNLVLLEKGQIDAIISQRPTEQGHDALLSLYRSIVLGQDVRSKTEIPLDVYIKENVPSLS
jgi:LacI family transcriptional regulator